jgi:hypothetical protein
MVLTSILIGGGVFFGLRIADMSNQIYELQNSVYAVQISYNNLQSSYNEVLGNYQLTLNNYNLLDANNKVLQSNYNLLNADFESLQGIYRKLEADYESLESNYRTLQGKVTTLQINNDKLQLRNRDLERLLSEYENVPHSYYSASGIPQHSNTWEDLGEFLSYEFSLPTGYEKNVFDCSESTAYLEWALENAGFDAYIAVGPTPWDQSEGYHAWVLAYTVDYRVAIEATALTGEYHWAYLFNNRIPGVIYGDDNMIPGWENYDEGYDDSFRNIYYAICDFGTGKEWNWWEGYFEFQ